MTLPDEKSYPKEKWTKRLDQARKSNKVGLKSYAKFKILKNDKNILFYLMVNSNIRLS